VKLIDLTGQTFGRLTVIERDRSRKKPVYWSCICSCENRTIKSIVASSLLKGKTKSCGCIRRETIVQTHLNNKKYNLYDLTGEYGIGYTFNANKSFYFSLEDYELIKNNCWRENSNGYIETSINRKNVLMHRIIMNAKADEDVDHIHHNTNDNRREQLRIVTTSQNCMNSSLNKGSTSGVKGVTWNRFKGYWEAHISVNGKNMVIGRTYSDIESATKARKEAEEKYQGKYSYDNSMKLSKDDKSQEQKDSLGI